MRKRRFGGTRAALALLPLAILAAACSSPSASPGVAQIGGASTTTVPLAAGSSPSPFANPQKMYQYAVSYAVCMRAHGLANFPDPNPPHGRGFSFNPSADSKSPGFARASAACKHFLPDSGGGLTPAQQSYAAAQMLKYSRCMRSHGIPDFPDPVINSHEMGFRIPAGVSPHSPVLKHANSACQHFLPGGGP